MTDANARLVYSGESGGLNESFSDVMGALVDRYIDGSVNSDTWKIGEDAFTPGTSGDALRYMASPASDGGSLDFYTTSAGSVDVHYSSGIPNLAFKLLATGGSHPRLGGSYVNGLGIDAAAWIWMRAHRYYMTSTSTFSDARNATMLASADGYGASTWITASVDAAWDNVGVYGDLAQTGYLSGAGAGANLPNGSYYYSASNGNHSGKLQPNTAGVNFALYLYKWNGSAWAYVAGSATGSGNQSVTYAGTPGYYIWMAYSHSGAGNFTAMLAHP
jgi:vibriolysin